MKFKKLGFGNVVDKEEISGDITFVPERVKILPDRQSPNQLSVTSNSRTNNDTSISPGGRNTGGFPYGITSGKSYTLLVKCSVQKKITSIMNTGGLRASIELVENGNITWGYAKSNIAPNELGEWLLTLVFDVPLTATGLFIRLNAGMYEGEGEVIWSDLALIDQKVLSIAELNTSKYEGLLHYDWENAVLDINTSKVYDYYQDLKHLTKYTQSDPLYLEILETLRIGDFSNYDLLQKVQKLYRSGDKKKVDNYLNQLNSLDLKKIDPTKFLTTHSTNIASRYELLLWSANNLDRIKNMVAEPENKSKSKEFGKFPVFVFWAQGIDQIPEIVNVCIKKLQTTVPTENLHILTDSNINYYIDIPSQVLKLKDKSLAHLADYYRVALLERYGGIWIDATTMVKSNFYDDIKFLLKENTVLTPRYLQKGVSTSISNWFIAVSQPKNRIISMVRAALLLWMTDHDQFIYYYHFHAILDFLLQLDEDSMVEWEKQKVISAVEAHELQRKQYDNLSQFDIYQIIEKNLVNKMTYKYDLSKVSLDSAISKIIRRNLE